MLNCKGRGMADGSTDINLNLSKEIDVGKVFGFDSKMKVMSFAEKSERVPEIDSTYKFDPDTTLAIIAGL